MLVVLRICILLQFTVFCSEMSPKIVGGDYPNITQFPHSASLEFKCVDEDGATYYACGASIVNQGFLLTAAHCMHDCMEDSSILIAVGHCNHKHGNRYTGHSYLVHDEYHHGRSENDIALVKLRMPIKFSATVGRVALMKKPPYKERARVAGWGAISEVERICGDQLKFVDQYVWPRKECEEALNGMPEGTICASSGSEEDYASIGDSGGALVVRGYVQLGIVSYKKPSVSRNLIVYTDTGYFYDWIQENGVFLYCDEDNEK